MENTQSDTEKRRAEILELLKLKAEWIAGMPKATPKKKVEEKEPEKEELNLEDFDELQDEQQNTLEDEVQEGKSKDKEEDDRSYKENKPEKDYQKDAIFADVHTGGKAKEDSYHKQKVKEEQFREKKRKEMSGTKISTKREYDQDSLDTSIQYDG